MSRRAAAAAERRAREWVEATGADDALFDERLASIGLDRRAFVRLLASREDGHPPVPREPRQHAAWRGVLDDLRSGATATVRLPVDEWKNPDGSVSDGPPFASFLQPFLASGAAKLRSGVAGIEARLPTGSPPVVSAAAERRFLRHLTERLVKQCGSTLILELHAARLRGQLRGGTPAQRWRDFSGRFFTPAKVFSTLQEYPVLGRLLASTVCRWSAAHLEFLTRYARDREHLAGLGPNSGPMGVLADLTLGVSDLHRRGRSVVIARDDEGHVVVYKPRSLAVDVQMQRLLAAVNGFGMRHPLAGVRQLDRDGYGWQEHVANAACKSPEELKRFYWRQGALVALLHLVRGADVHHENLIACGEHPVLVDNETLFHNVLPFPSGGETARAEAAVELRRSVIRQALLPFVYRLTGEGEGVESSGLGGAGGQVARGSVRRWADPATDQMRVVVGDLVTAEAANRPTLAGESVSAAAFAGEIVAGFRETYELLIRHRAELHPLLDAFAGLEVRFLVRPTRLYSVFLRESHHPNDLLDGLDRDALLDRLWAWGTSIPSMRRLIPFEHEDLREEDVPVFVGRPDGVHLESSGGQRIDDCFEQPALETAHRTLDGLSPEDCERQALIVRLALSEGAGDGEAGAGEETAAGMAIPLREGSTAGALERAAIAAGDLLKRRALVGRRGVCWISMEPFVADRPGGDRRRNVTLAGDDLYHGGAGIALFLAYLGELTDDPDATELARGTVRAILDERNTAPAPDQVVGAYLGRAGWIYTLLHLAAVWSEPALLDAALAELPAVEARIGSDRELDLLGGSAGCALVLARLFRATGEAEALRAARRCGDHLLARAEPVGEGLAWSGESFRRPVAGLSHGAAGIAWALAELATVTGDDRYRRAAERAIVFERGLLRSEQNEPFHARVAWCHGLPSVALGRLMAGAALDDPSFAQEIAAGAERVLSARPPLDDCLCHGGLGNADILLTAARHLRRVDWEGAARHRADAVAARVMTLEDQPLLPVAGRFAGLLCGLAGIGYGLLRFARGERVPSILTLEPPQPC